MSTIALVVIVAWLPITLFIFSQLPSRTAVILCFIGGLLFLPRGVSIALPLIPDYAGQVATCYGIFLGILLFDTQRFQYLKPNWLDLPISIWCICPLFSSLTNDLGAYDGINETLNRIALWGMPYLFGRLYLTSLTGLRELSLNIVKGGLLYVPLCLYEVRMSPQLHNMVYGYYPSSFMHVIRYGGFRPLVFMDTGLMVGMWMMAVTFVALWLWQARVLREIWGMPLNWLVVTLILTSILIKSTGVYIYFLYGLVILFAARQLRTSLPIWLLAIAISFYLYLGVTGGFNGDEIVSWASDLVGPDRAQSLEFRFDNETLLADKAREKLWFGWGGWGRSRVYQEDWQGDLVDVSVTDSMWIIAFGNNGLVGLASAIASLLLPVVSFCLWKYPARTWFHPKVAPAAVLAVVLALFAWDCLLNYMFIPIFPLIAGGLGGLAPQKSSELKKMKKVPRSMTTKRSPALRRLS